MSNYQGKKIRTRATANNVSAALIALSLLSSPQIAAATNTLVSVESTNSYAPCGISPDLANSNSGGTSFYTELLRVNAVGFSLAHAQYMDGATWNTDFMDPGTSNAPTGASDYLYADAPNTAISYFQGHGIDDNQEPYYCSSYTLCEGYGEPGAGVIIPGAPATCAFSPWTYDTGGAGAGVCVYATRREGLTCGNDDEGSPGDTAYPYGTSTHKFDISGPNVLLGNNSSVGAWRGMGTSGGTALAIFHMSHGMGVWFPNAEWSNLYGGVRIFESMLTGPGGDTNDSPHYGYWVANPYSVNPNSAVGASLANSISSITDGAGCPDGVSSPAYVGYAFAGGFNGCGCNTGVSFGGSATESQNLMNETWRDLALVYTYPTSRTYLTADYACNYNPVTYPYNGGD